MFSKSMLRLYYSRAFIIALIFCGMMLFSFMSYITVINKCIEINNDMPNEKYTADEIYSLLRKNNIECYAFYEESEIQYIDIDEVALNGLSSFSDFAFGISIAGAIGYFIKTIFSTYGKRSYSFIGILPYKRHIHYVNQWLSAVFIFIVPYILSVLLCMYIRYAYDIQCFSCYVDINYHISKILVTICLLTLFIMLSKLFGNPLYCGLFIGLFLFGYECFLIGMNKIFDINLGPDLDFTYLKTMACAVTFTIVFFIIGMLLHKIYPVEKIGDIFIFKWLKYIVYIIGSIFGGFGLYSWLDVFIERKFTSFETGIILILGMAITAYSVSYIINLMENGGNERENKAFIKIRA